MSQHKGMCPFLKSPCIECPVYRGRHANLWAGDLSVNPSAHNGDGSSPISAFDSFLQEVKSLTINDER